MTVEEYEQIEDSDASENSEQDIETSNAPKSSEQDNEASFARRELEILEKSCWTNDGLEMQMSPNASWS